MCVYLCCHVSTYIVELCQNRNGSQIHRLGANVKHCSVYLHR